MWWQYDLEDMTRDFVIPKVRSKSGKPKDIMSLKAILAYGQDVVAQWPEGVHACEHTA